MNNGKITSQTDAISGEEVVYTYDPARPWHAGVSPCASLVPMSDEQPAGVPEPRPVDALRFAG